MPCFNMPGKRASNTLLHKIILSYRSCCSRVRAAVAVCVKLGLCWSVQLHTHRPPPQPLMAASHYGIPSFPIVKFVIYHVTAWVPLKLTLPSILPPFPSSLPPSLMGVMQDGDRWSFSPRLRIWTDVYLCSRGLSGSLHFPC